MDKRAEDLTGADVQQLLGLYKQAVTKYSMLSKALGQLNITEDQLLYPFKRKSSTATLSSVESPQIDCIQGSSEIVLPCIFGLQ